MDYSKLSDATLKSLKEGRPLDYAKLSDDEVRELSKAQKGTQAPPEASPVSKTESALRGAAQGASLGFADELTGGGEALGDLLSGNSDFLDNYRKHRDESRANYKTAEEENPLSYLGGTLAGGLATPIPLGGAKTIGQMALTGAKLGAAAGLGAGEADLTQGELGKGIEETGKGALYGAGISGTLGALGKAGEAIAGSNVGKAFKEGLAGNKLVGKEARQKLGDELVQFAGKTGEDIQQRLTDEATRKNQILKDADASGQKLDVTDFLNKIYPDEASKLPKSYTSEGDSARRALAEPMERAKGIKPPQDEMQNLMAETYGNPDVTHMEVAPQKVEMSPTEIDSFRRALGRLGFEKDLKDDQVVALAKRLSGKVSEKANKEIPNLEGANSNITNLLDAQDIFNIGNGLDEMGNQVKLTPLLQRLESDSLSSDIARSRFGKGVDALKSADEKLGQQVEQKGTDLAERYDLSRDLNKPISLTGNPAEMVKRVSGKVSNIAGYGIQKAADTVPGKIVSTTFNAAPEFINSLAVKLEAKGSKFAPILKNLANESEPKRKALMFSLMQQPAFRQAIESGDDQ